MIVCYLLTPFSIYICLLFYPIELFLRSTQKLAVVLVQALFDWIMGDSRRASRDSFGNHRVLNKGRPFFDDSHFAFYHSLSGTR